MKKYIIEAYRRLGIMLLIFLITVIFASPLIAGLVLGIVVNHYWFFLIFGLLLTLPLAYAFISRLVDGDII